MIAERLRVEVLEASRVLAKSGLVMGTFGNVSGVDRQAGLFVIKPSGVDYEKLTPADMVPVSLADGSVLEGDAAARRRTRRPTSSSTSTSTVVAWSTPTRSARPRSRRRACRCGAWGPPTPITSAATCR